MRVVIAGGGTAGWLAAAILTRQLAPLVDVTLVESEEIGTVGVGESTIPTVRAFHALIGLDEAEFMAATGATFKLGISFENWARAGDRYIHSFGDLGRSTWMGDFHHFFLEGRGQGMAGEIGDYSLEHRAAAEGRFATGGEPPLNYAYHFDAGRYARYLRSRCEAAGLTRVEGRIERVERDGRSGHIAALHLSGGRRVAGDLFLDCTGFRALLIEQALHVGYDDWTHWLPCDAAIAVQTESVRPPVPFTRAMAHDAGWQWRIPLQHRVGNGIVYCSRYLSQDAALDRLLGNVEGAVLTEPNRLRFVTGARRKQWHRNCIAIGLAGGFMEPLESTSIHLIQRAILRLIRLLPPAGAISAHDIAEFNDQQLTDMDQIRDFLILHYKVTERRDSPFWRQCAAMDIPDSLAQKIGLFRETGRVFRRNDELFAENSWIQVMLGQGIVPQTHHPIAAKLPDDELARFLGGLRQGVATTVRGLPAHADYVARYCGAAPA